MEKTIDLTRIDADQLCEMFNEGDDILKEKGTSRSDIIMEFRNRKIATVNIQRASGRIKRIWYNSDKNCIEVHGRCFFEGTDLLQW